MLSITVTADISGANPEELPSPLAPCTFGLGQASSACQQLFVEQAGPPILPRRTAEGGFIEDSMSNPPGPAGVAQLVSTNRNPFLLLV